MKTLLFLLAFVWATLASAKVVPQAEVLDMATLWRNQGARADLGEVSMTPYYVQDEPAFYVVNFAAGGWAVMSAEDLTYPVLAWSDTGVFGDGQGVEAVQAFLFAWTQAIEEVRGDPTALFVDDWNYLPGEAARERTVLGPYMTSRWGQGVGWNAFCPADAAGPGGHAYAGCVATTLAQVMYYWKHPKTRAQNVSDYEHDVYGWLGIIYDEEPPLVWGAMTDAAPTTESARLTYWAGIGVRMNYGPHGSSASTSSTATALKSYFRYSPATRTVWKSAFSAAAWDSLLLVEMENARPVLYRGQGPSGGHSFALDGYDTNGYWHLNFGWSGSYNGWYLLTAISPGRWDFSAVQGAVIGVEPRGKGLKYPADGQENIPWPGTLLQWDPRPGTVSYTVQVAQRNDFRQPLFAQTLQGVKNTRTWMKVALPPATKLYWRVSYLSATGQSVWSDTVDFKTAPSASVGGSGKPLILN